MEEGSAFEEVPVELIQNILFETTSFHQPKDKHGRSDEGALCQLIICRFVCKLWRDLLPTPSSFSSCTFLVPFIESEEERMPRSPDWLFSFTATMALMGNLSLLKWARGQGCGWDFRTCAKAAEGGHLGGVDVGERARVCMESTHVCFRSPSGSLGGVEMGASKWLPFRRHLYGCW